ncbi:28 kDa inner dynein arm light chain, axonemal, partial [Phlyctochytrium bullatum]
MISPTHSLVRYDNPVLVSKTDGGNKAGAKGNVGGDLGKSGKPPLGGQPTGSKKLPPVDDKGRTKTPNQTEDILNSILPPREWEETGQLWVQKVSSTPATRLDVINLQ